MDPQRFDTLAKAFATPISRRRVFKGILGGAGGGVLSLLGARVGAQVSTVGLNPTSGPAGTRVTATGSNFPPGHEIAVQWDGGQELARTTVNDAGGFSVDFNVPAGATPGGHDVFFVDSTGNLGFFIIARFTVTGQSSCEPGQENCNGVCVDTSSDPNNCSRCGEVCESGQCRDFACVPVDACGGQCADGGGEVCCGGVCCGSFGSLAEVCCGDACIDARIDPVNCGECGNSCDDGNPCTVDTCENQQCVNTPIDGCCTASSQCDDGNPCTLDTCHPDRTCSDLPFNSGETCTVDGISGTCLNGVCVTNPCAGVVCEDDACVTRGCDPATGAGVCP